MKRHAMKIQLAANPVLVKELRGRMRGPRAYLFLTGTLLLLGIVTYGLYRLVAFTSQAPGMGPPGALVGQGIFTGLVFLATMVICAIAPSLSAGAVSGEYEHKTFDLLMATPLRASSVLIGKLIAALSYSALILIAAVPLVSLSFVFGGVSTLDMVQVFLLLLGYALTYSVIGMFFSALFRRTGLAVGASYAVLALFVFGTVFAYAVVGVMQGRQPPNWMLALNPFSAIASALVNTSAPSPYSSSLLAPFLLVMGGGMISSTAPGGFAPTAHPLWQYTIGIYGWLTVVLYLLTTQLVKPVRRFQPRGRVLGITVLLLILSGVGPLVAYGSFSLDSVLSHIRWTLSTPRDLITDGQFKAPLGPEWGSVTQAARSGESGGDIKVISTHGRQAVQLLRNGRQSAETSLTQVISQTVPADGWLQLRAVVRINSTNIAQCGTDGSSCPIQLKVTYEDRTGWRRVWTQGFFSTPGSGPIFCTTCESKQAHVRVPEGQWYMYESPNLLEVLALPPRLIQSLTITAAGNAYDVEIAEVTLLAREGRPLNSTAAPVAFPTATPVFFRGGPPGVMIAPAMQPIPPTIVPPVAPRPTLTGAPPPVRTVTVVPMPTPSGWPQGSPSYNAQPRIPTYTPYAPP